MPVHYAGVNAWYKPIKFALSIGIYAWSMALFIGYLGSFSGRSLFEWAVIVLLAFEIIYIAIQASRGQLSHFNTSSSFYSAMYGAMGLAAVLVTLLTLYVGVLFFRADIPQLPDYYVWSIRLGIMLFVVFSFEGGMMGSRMSHTVGAPDGGDGLRFLNWSRTNGDLRVAHFIGMHALQVLPLMAFYVLKNTKAVFVFSGLYLLLAVWVLVQALQGRPFLKG